MFAKLLAILGLLAAPDPTISRAENTTKFMNDFVSCFVVTQDRVGAAWWFVPNDDGGRISNEGDERVDPPYSIHFIERVGSNRIEVSLVSSGEKESALLAAVHACS